MTSDGREFRQFSWRDAPGIRPSVQQHLDNALSCIFVLELDGKVQRSRSVEAVLQVDIGSLGFEEDGEGVGRRCRGAVVR